jgi:murein DD-endopeptidase MepM/ murein hydrolase activator NlpD
LKGFQNRPQDYQKKMQKYFTFFKKMTDFFRPKGDDGRTLLEKLRDKYRLVIMNDETFEEVTSVKLSPLSVYIAVSSLIVGTAILVTMLIIWTPLKRYIPGYGDFQRNGEIAELTSKIQGLENEIEATHAYNENIRKILTGDMASFSKEEAQKQSVNVTQSDSISKNVERIKEDDQLRAAVAKGNVSGDNATATTTSTASVATRDKPLEQLYFVPPVTGETTSGFEPAKDHFGIDVTAPKNTAVKSAADGVVISSGYTVETGYSISIQHPNNVVTMYKHNSVCLKKAGNPVKAGEAIGIVGNTGEQSTGPHLHFELWYKGRPVNPTDYINFK